MHRTAQCFRFCGWKSAVGGAVGLFCWIHAQTAQAARTEWLDMARLAEHTAVEAIPSSVLAAVLAPKKTANPTFSQVVRLSDGSRAVAWSDCSQKTCQGRVALLAAGSMEKLEARATAGLPLPARPWGNGGLHIDYVALHDIDLDNLFELLIQYTVTQPPRPDGTSLRHEWLIAFNLPALKPMFKHEMRTTGAPIDDLCDWRLGQIDLNNDTHPDLQLFGTCQRQDCSGLKRPPRDCDVARKQEETYTWKPVTDQYGK